MDIVITTSRVAGGCGHRRLRTGSIDTSEGLRRGRARAWRFSLERGRVEARPGGPAASS